MGERADHHSRSCSLKAALLCRGDIRTQHLVRVRVDAEKVVRTVDARHFGINAVMWDSHFDTPGTLSALRDLGVQALRFPGGSPSDDYHWAFNRNGRNAWNWATPFSSFIPIATNLPAQVFIDLKLYGWRQYGDHGIMCGNDTRHPTFYTFKLLKYFARAGDRIVGAASNSLQSMEGHWRP